MARHRVAPTQPLQRQHSDDKRRSPIRKDTAKERKETTVYRREEKEIKKERGEGDQRRSARSPRVAHFKILKLAPK